MTFYFKHVNIENYESIISEVRHFVKTLGLDKSKGFCNVSSAELLSTCPLISEWFSAKHMRLRATGVIITPPTRSQNIHTDLMAEQWSQLALNLNIENCEIPKTSMFTTTAKRARDITYSGAPYFKYPEDAVFTKVAEFDLTTPVLFNTQVPHQVQNNTASRRVSISFRFYEDPQL